jgi:GT2 family glycosyltransferase
MAQQQVPDQLLSGEWPSVTVVVPTHFRPQLLQGAVRTILEQRYPGRIECLIVFDREEPVAPEVDIGDRREVRVMVNDRTPGPAGGVNVGMVAAHGDYVALCNDDDEWLPDKLRLQVGELEATGLAVCGSGIILEGERRVRRPVRVPRKDRLELVDLLQASRTELHASTLVFRRSALDEIGLIDEDIPGSYGEDYDWLLRAVRVSPIAVVRRPLVRVRWQHSYFSEQWELIVEALTYQLARRPELKRDRRNLARIYGRLGFACAALGRWTEGRSWTKRSLRADWRQPRGYLAYLVAYRLVRPQTLLKMAHRVGRGI